MKILLRNLTLMLIAFSGTATMAQPCLSNKPLPHCRTFFITELGYSYKATSPLIRKSYSSINDTISFSYSDAISGRHLLHSELGLMRNLNANFAVGASHFLAWDVGHNFHGGFKLRVRKWFNDKMSLDLSGGPLLWGAEGEYAYPGFVGGASLNFSDWESINMTVTQMKTKGYDYTFDANYEGRRYRNYSPAEDELAVYLGYKFSSKPGLALNAAALASVAVVVGVFLSTVRYD